MLVPCLHGEMGFTREGEVLITEILAGGNTTLADEDKEYPDWIEIGNTGSTDISLEGWYLTDDPVALTKWAFPDVILPGGSFLVIFASGKDRRNPAAPLHTNFQLSEAGEFLALVKPDGQTIAHAYSPSYPDMTGPRDGFSFGLVADLSELAGLGTPVRLRVPANGDLGLSWTLPEFDDSSWKAATLGAGFGSRPGVFAVTTYKANIQVTTLAEADEVIQNPARQVRTDQTGAAVLNFLDNSTEGHFPENQPFPGHAADQDVDDFVVRAVGDVMIPSDGTWTFGINSDDGARLRIDGRDVIVDDTLHGPQDVFGIVNLTTGPHEIELVYFERGGGAELELFAAAGEHTDVEDGGFRLVGDAAGGGLSLGGFGDRIRYDAGADMKGINSTVYIRVPFSIADPSLPYSIYLEMNYNDGFVTYLNGREVARRNAPMAVAWNSSAAAKLPAVENFRTEEINLTDIAPELRAGANILAIQGLNAGKDDPDLLIQPVFKAAAVVKDSQRYFKKPTPGAANGTGVVGFVDPPLFSRERGFYDQPFEVTMTTPTAGAVIRYTTDGRAPTESVGVEYTGPVPIPGATILRAAAFKPGHEPSASITQTYIFLSEVIQQKRPAGYPTRWGGGVSADYDMDPDVVNDARYRNTIREDLKSIPSMSIVMDPTDLFGARDGIYTHPESKGDKWERFTSAEFIYPDGRPGYQVNSGIQIQGGYGRVPAMRKHSLRLVFKREYGPPALRYRVFDDSPVDQFDTLVLRSNYNYTWHGSESGFGSTIGRAEYMRDEFSRRTQRDLGQPASHGTYVHLYLNGMYWGLYNLVERPDESFAASYLGGEKEEYDIVTGGTRNIGTTQVKAGNKQAWNAMMAVVESNTLSAEERYRQIQPYLNVDNLIDYMLTIIYTGNRDAPTVIGGGGTPWNFYTGRRRLPGAGLHTFAWDSEWTLEETAVNVVDFHNGRDNPGRIFQRLRPSAEFRMRVADRIQKHFFHGGVLTPEASQARYAEIARFIDRAIVGESARWGDAPGGRARTRDDDWVKERDRILNQYLTVRSGIVLEQLRKAKLYPTLPAPEFNQPGGVVEPGFALTMTVDTGGEPTPVTLPLVAIDHEWKYEQSGKDLGTAWIQPGYDDSAWPLGKALLYVETADLPAAKNTPLKIGKTTYYFRTSFEVPAEVSLKDAALEMSTILDDGAVIYLNGVEVSRIRMAAGIVSAAQFSTETVSEAVLEGPLSISAASLKTGKNVVAVEVHQTNAGSTDVVWGMTLTAKVIKPATTSADVPVYYTLDGRDPRLPGGEADNAHAKRYAGPVILNENSQVKARAFDGQTWSALSEARFFINQPAQDVAFLRANLKITELMYNPAAAGNFEFIELHNTHPETPLVLSGVEFTEGIQFRFPEGTIIPPQGYLVLTQAQGEAEQAAFRKEYRMDDAALLAGPFTGKLANEGEPVVLRAPHGGPAIVTFEYGDGPGWPAAADGAGHSLVPLARSWPDQDLGALNYGGNWRASAVIGGSPGKEDPEPVRNVVMNEILVDSPDGAKWVELFNSSRDLVHLGGWYLSDDNANLKKWPVSGVEIQHGGFLSLDEKNHLDIPAGSGFGLSPQGGALYLSYLPGVPGVDRVVDALKFAGQEAGVAWGRHEDGQPYWVGMKPSRDMANQPGLERVVIDEIMYHPPDLQPSGDENVVDEYMELWNPTDQAVPLFTGNGAWRIYDGIEYTFAPNTTLPPNGRILLVKFDPADPAAVEAFKAKYKISTWNVLLLGPFNGKLSNQGERIALEKPLGNDLSGLLTTWAVADEVIYFDQSPWTQMADGTGQALQRISARRPGNDPANWQAADPTPGQDNPDTPVNAWMAY
ncbi:MAG: lamin tail domain-containing protein [bacterium]